MTEKRWVDELHEWVEGTALAGLATCIIIMMCALGAVFMFLVLYVTGFILNFIIPFR